jgi:hypothetical protein
MLVTWMVGAAAAATGLCDKVQGMSELGLDGEAIVRALDGTPVEAADAACLGGDAVPEAVRTWALLELAERAVAAPTGDLPGAVIEEEPAESAPRDDAALPAAAPAVASDYVSNPAAVADAERFVWVGVDFALVQMVGSDFADLDAIFPGHASQWNARMGSAEAMQTLAWVLGEPVKPSAGHLDARHASVEREGRLREGTGGDHLISEIQLPTEDIARAVASYELAPVDELGLVFIVESMLKEAEVLCLQAVFFEVDSRTVVHAQRYCEPAKGMTFSTHWQAPLERAVKDLRRDVIAWDRESR